MSIYWYSFNTKTRYKEKPEVGNTYLWEDIEKRGEIPYFCFPDGMVELKNTELAGQALFAKRDIKKGELVWHYDIDGEETEVLSRAELWAMPRKERMEWYVYAWQFDEDLITGPNRKKPLTNAKQRDAINFLNHSCDPNLCFDSALMVRAMKDIKAGEILSYDYSTSETDVSFAPFGCECGSENCRGILSSFDYRISKNQEIYKGKMFPLVEKMIEIEKRAKMGEGPYRELNSKVEAKPCADDVLGKGLFAAKKILKGEPIWIDQSPWNHPEIPMSLEQINSLPKEDREFAITYGQEIDTDLINVPKDIKTVEENYFYLINHSCDPNTAVYSSTIWLAFRDILPGEEITIDYATLGHQIQRISEKCFCGSSVCRGSVTKDDYKNKLLQERYGSYWKPHMLALIWKLHQN